MNKVIILTPVFNDWESLRKLLKEINIYLNKTSNDVEILIVDDCSTIKEGNKFQKRKNIRKIKILRLKKNSGSQKAIFIGLKYLQKLKANSIIVVMDSDGEDNVRAINNLIKLARKNSDSVITANRLKRSEGLFFTLLYKIHLFLTFILTGKYLDFGNFSAFNSKKLNLLLKNNYLKMAYSAGVVKNVENIISFYTKRKKRYFGYSKVNFLFLFQHSLNILTVFKNKLFLRSVFLSFLSYTLYFYYGNKFFLAIIFVILIINIFIFINLFIYKLLKN
jgi:glycosyltransferase involved in cell wall biosynthesis